MSFPRRRNPVKHIKNKFFICLFYQICNFYINIEVIFLDPRLRGDDIESVLPIHVTTQPRSS
ncbi:hypothetical protein [Rickettsia hoogstraalii]|uniref:hypothetical protein n=1 Tax=Rickettsia hoogstraalii TaxID=467174 RepID=UPI0012E08EEF|nr:hypothetical protein [Rickettsia hoogstraalii]